MENSQHSTYPQTSDLSEDIICLLSKLEDEDKSHKNELGRIKILLFYATSGSIIHFNWDTRLEHVYIPHFVNNSMKILDQKGDLTRAVAFQALVHTVFKPKDMEDIDIDMSIVTMAQSLQYLPKTMANQFLQEQLREEPRGIPSERFCLLQPAYACPTKWIWRRQQNDDHEE